MRSGDTMKALIRMAVALERIAIALEARNLQEGSKATYVQPLPFQPQPYASSPVSFPVNRWGTTCGGKA